MAHIDAGKTTITERILFYTNKSHKIGEVHEGNTTMDWMKQEKERGITITSAATTCFWKNNQNKIIRINIIDTPGHVDFTIEVERTLRVLDGAIAVFDAVAGVEPQSETVWKQANKYNVPRLCFINKMDRIGANIKKCIKMIKERLNVQPLIIQMPIGQEKSFYGIIDLLSKKSILWNKKNKHEYSIEEIPIKKKDEIEKQRLILIENIIESNEELMNKYLMEEEIGINDLKHELKKKIIKGGVNPVLLGSAFKNKGIQLLLHAISDFLPSPIESNYINNNKVKINNTCALAFKIMNDPYVGSITFIRMYSGELKCGNIILNSRRKKKEKIGRIMIIHANKREEIEKCINGDIVGISGLKYTITGDTLCDIHESIILEKIKFPEPVIEIAIEALSNDDHCKMIKSINRLIYEDPSIKIKIDHETNQTKISGMGELHLEIILDRLRREFNVNVKTGKPEVAYKETINGRYTIDYIHKKQTGGAGQYARVKIIFEKNNVGSGYTFINKITGGNIPKEYIPAIKKSIYQSSKTGVIKGYPLIDFKAILIDGDYHTVDSSALAFEIAAKYAFKEGAKNASPIILEPIMKVEINIPTEHLGSVIAHINQIHGEIKEIISNNKYQLIKSYIPLSCMFGYVNKLRTMTKGRGYYNMYFLHYKKYKEKKLKK